MPVVKSWSVFSIGHSGVRRRKCVRDRRTERTVLWCCALPPSLLCPVRCTRNESDPVIQHACIPLLSARIARNCLGTDSFFSFCPGGGDTGPRDVLQRGGGDAEGAERGRAVRVRVEVLQQGLPHQAPPVLR